MTDTVSIPYALFQDRRVKGNHVRVFAAVLMLAGSQDAREVSRESGIDRSDIYRVLQDLYSWNYLIKSIGGNPTYGESPYRGNPPTLETTPKRVAGPEPRGSRMAEEWRPAEKHVDAMLEAGWGLDEIEDEIEKFIDYWTARAGAGARKVNWNGTWKIWIRKATDEANDRDQRAAGPSGNSRVVPLQGPSGQSPSLRNGRSG